MFSAGDVKINIENVPIFFLLVSSIIYIYKDLILILYKKKILFLYFVK